MAILRPDEYKHNNPNRAIVDSDFTRGGVRVVNDVTALYALSTKSDQLKQYVTLVFVISLGYWVKLVDITNIGNANGWEPLFDPNIKAAPYAQRNQIQFALEDSSNEYFADDLVEVGNFIYTDAQLERSRERAVSQETIFNQWKRFSHSYNFNGLPSIPSETNTFTYDSGASLIRSTVNSASLIGFISPRSYTNYIHNLTIKSTHTTENDVIGTLIAYAETDDLITNNAQGLDPNIYPGLDVASAQIKNQHTLTLVRSRTDQTASPGDGSGQIFPSVIARYAVVYNFGKTDSIVIANGDSLLPQVLTPYNGAECDLRVVRQGDIIKVYTTKWSTQSGGKGSLDYEITVDLTSIPELAKFRGSAPYGYVTYSQPLASFENISTNISENDIYDLRDGHVEVTDNSGNYVTDPTRNYFTEIGERRILHNPYEDTTVYIDYDGSIRILASKNDSVANQSAEAQEASFWINGDGQLNNLEAETAQVNTAPINAEDVVRLEDLNNLDAEVVHTSGDETINGVKTFTTSPIVPDADNLNEAVNLGQLADVVDAQEVINDDFQDQIDDLVAADYHETATQSLTPSTNSMTIPETIGKYIIEVIRGTGTIYRTTTGSATNNEVNFNVATGTFTFNDSFGANEIAWVKYRNIVPEIPSNTIIIVATYEDVATQATGPNEKTIYVTTDNTNGDGGKTAYKYVPSFGLGQIAINFEL